MAERRSQMTLRVDAGLGADPEEIDELTLRLRRELLDLDVESVDLVATGDPPQGAKGVGLVSLGTLVVTLTQSPGMLGAVVGLVQSWLSGSGRRTVKIELDGDVLEVSGLSSRDQRQLIASWIARHATG